MLGLRPGAVNLNESAGWKNRLETSGRIGQKPCQLFILKIYLPSLMSINPIRILKKSVGVGWQHPGQLVIINLLFLLFSLTIIGMPAAYLSLSHAASRLDSGRVTPPREFAQLWLRYFSHGLAIGLVYFVIVFLIMLNLSFYGSADSLWWGFRIFLRAVIVFIGLFFLLSSVYSPVLMVKSGLGPLQAIRAGSLLVLDNPLLTLFVFGLMMFWWLISIPTVLVFLLFGFSLPAVVQAIFTEELILSYGGGDE